MRKHLHRLGSAMIVALLVAVASCGSQPKNQPTTGDSETDMAIALAMLDGAEPSSAPEYMTVMDDLENLCQEDRNTIGGMAKGIADLSAQYGFGKMTYLEGMQTIRFDAESVNSADQIACIDIFTYYRKSFEESDQG